MASGRAIHAIPCTIASPRIAQAIGRVFRRIQRTRPEDWNRLRRRVQSVDYLPADVTSADLSVMGWWQVDEDHLQTLQMATARDPRLWGRGGREHYLARGRLLLARTAARLPPSRLVALIAHECGHAATRARDFERREAVGGDAEWASELCADLYAFRWGFEREIRSDAPFRRLAHHAALPGQRLWLGDQEFRVDRHFFLRPVQPA